MSQSPALSNLTTIQSLRGFAALAVILAHVRSIEMKFDTAPILGEWTLIGFGGVDLFFVISGFVMVWVTRANQGQVRAVPGFWLARILRIYPLWWLVLSAIVAVWMVRPDLVYSSMTAPPDILRSYLLIPASTMPLHAVGWTLVHEVWFYLVFGLLLMCPNRFFPAALVTWATLVVLGALLMPTPNDPFLAIMRHPLTLEFIGGAAIGWIATRQQLPFGNLMLRSGCLVLLLSSFTIMGNPTATFEAQWPRVAYFGLPCAMILWGYVSSEQAGRESPRWSQALGNWSFALYLIHVPVFSVVGRVLAPLSRPGPFDNIVVIGLALTGAIVTAWLLHIGFERPVQRLAHRILKRPANLA